MTLEQLLNKLIEKGRVPFGDEKIHSFEIIYVTGKIRNIVAKRGRGQVNEHYSIIELCSKPSGLWQFACDNGYNQYKKNYFHWFSKYGLKGEYWDTSDFEYYVLEAALTDEDKLEEFLLDNIKIGDI